jgi:hypothetical protein
MISNPYTRLHDLVIDVLADNLPVSWLDRNLGKVARIVDRFAPRYPRGAVVTLPPIGDRPRSSGRAWHEGARWAREQLEKTPLTFRADAPIDAYDGADFAKLVELQAAAETADPRTLERQVGKLRPAAIREATRLRDLANRKQSGQIPRSKADYWEGVGDYAKATLRRASDEDGTAQAEDLRAAVIEFLRQRRVS